MVRGSTDYQKNYRYQCISIVRNRGASHLPSLHTAMCIMRIHMHTPILCTHLDVYLKQWNSIDRSGLMSCMLSYPTCVRWWWWSAPCWPAVRQCSAVQFFLRQHQVLTWPATQWRRCWSGRDAQGERRGGQKRKMIKEWMWKVVDMRRKREGDGGKER